MSNEDRNDGAIYKVIVNDEGQYSIWLAENKNPPGWRDEGTEGTKEYCIDYVKMTTGQDPVPPPHEG